MALFTIGEARDRLGKAHRLAKRRKFQGLDVSVETAKGSYRHWYDPSAGEHGKTKLLYDYGYVRGSVGADGEHVDCYVGPDDKATHAFVVDQMKKPTFMEFDEQKVMLGFGNAEDAKRAYLACYNDPRFFGGIRTVPMEDFRLQVLATSEHQPLVMSEQHRERGEGDGPVDTHRPRLIIGGALRKGGPYIGPRGGKWADAKHTIAWRDDAQAEHTSRHGTFKTGQAVTFDATHRKQKTPNMGETFGQHIEPAGRYVTAGHNGKEGTTVEPGNHKVVTSHHEITFQNPLVVHADGVGWKHRLSAEHGGKKGKALSRALAKKGHDGVVTVDGKHLSEIVDLTHLRAEPKQPKWMAGNLGIERGDMPQIRSFKRDQFLDGLRKKGIEVKQAYPKASALKATQKNVHAAILERTRQGSDDGGGRVDNDKPILVSKDGFVLDGHHRWGAVVSGDKPDDTLNAIEISLPIRELLKEAHAFEDVEYHKSEEQFPRLYALRETLSKAQSAPAGFGPIPKGTRGGYRKRVGGKWVYWYPSAGEASGSKHAAAEVSEDDFAAGRFDKTPGNWHFIRAGKGRTEIHAWTVGGVDPESKHPVKRGGQAGKLYQIVEPFPGEHPGWALLQDVNRPGDDPILVKHTLVYPVEHSREGKQGSATPAGPKFDPTAPPGQSGPPTGWVTGSDVRIQPYPDSRAKKGTMLHRVERGHYPRKRRRIWQQDVDGVPRKQETEVLFMPEGDKVMLLGEMQGLVRKAAERARTKLGVGKTREVVEDLRSASMEGLLHAVDNYRGGYSFVKSAMSYAEQHARLHAAREFAGGFGMRQAEQRMLPGFLAARAEANRVMGGDADVPTVAKMWNLRKRDRHKGLAEGKNDPIPLGDYSLRAGEIVTGKDKPGKLRLAQEFVEFVDGQKGHVDLGPDESGPMLPGAGVGIAMGTTERLEAHHDLEQALGGVERFDVVVGRQVYRVNAADVLRRRLGLGMEPQSPHAIAGAVPIYRITRGGSLKALSPRAAFDLIGATVEQSLDRIRGELKGDVAGLVERARHNLAEPPTASRGMTARQRIEAASRKVTREDIQHWRSGERERLRKLEGRFRHDGDEERAGGARRMRDRLKTIGRREAARHIAEQRILMQPRSREWFRNAIATPIELVDSRNQYGSAVITMTDLGTGKQRQVKVRTVREFMTGDEAYKSDADPGTVPDMAILRLVSLFPRLAHALWGSDDALAYAPSVERAAVLEAMGF